ncbi:MAG TPA: tryptophan 2,3-dioxygenase [Planctomycetes bacterium]|nr:tryptophan 2,3-dioxygenase [Planctomycetota bacterium]HIK59704.1 tryptophan 2,3-dioxygenase [Planctomycetota bacterium]
MTTPRPTSYWDYIHVEDLLSLQDGLPEEVATPSNDEVLFITVHQIFELWFQLVLRELNSARDLFGKGLVQEQELSGAVASLRRISTILSVAADHFRVMETLPTREYLEFRKKLLPASGGQSAQMRQIEVLFGLDDKDRVPLGDKDWHMNILREADGSEGPAYKRVADQMKDGPSLRSAIESWLLRTPIDGVAHDDPDAEVALERFISRYLAAHRSEVEANLEHSKAIMQGNTAHEDLENRYRWEAKSAEEFLRPSEDEGGARIARVRAAMVFIETYRELPLLAWPREVLNELIRVEQRFLIFRQRHARMVERIIGSRTGTGGSEGVKYLDETALRYRIFRDLWAVRTLMIRPGATPELDRPEFYGFRSDG